jgi:hypothetical protein
MKTRVDFSRNEVASMMRREIGVGGEIRGEGGKDKRGVKQRREERKRRLGSLGGEEEWREWNGKRGLDLILPEAPKHSPRFARVWLPGTSGMTYKLQKLPRG